MGQVCELVILFLFSLIFMIRVLNDAHPWGFDLLDKARENFPLALFSFFPFLSIFPFLPLLVSLLRLLRGRIGCLRTKTKVQMRRDLWF